MREAGKDHPALKLTEAAPTPAPARRTERPAEMRPEPRPVELCARAGRSAAHDRPASHRRGAGRGRTLVRQEPVVMAATADGDGAGSPASAAAGTDRRAARAPPQSPIGTIVNTLKPSSLFARAREFGEKIEAAGNEILPSIRQ